GDIDVEADALVFLPLYVIHRHELLWDRPEVFWPQRFAGDNLRRIPKFAYRPFGLGPRTCVGNSFAMLESVTLLAEFLRHVRFRLVDATDPVPVARITLRPKGGLRLAIDPAG
ncbi:MAG: cytochrome P450, partial [Pseudomonadota bacterium]